MEEQRQRLFPTVARGGGRGRNKTLPAWMTSPGKQNLEVHVTDVSGGSSSGNSSAQNESLAVAQGQAHAQSPAQTQGISPSQTLTGTTESGFRCSSVGRGRAKTMPAWMTSPGKRNNTDMSGGSCIDIATNSAHQAQETTTEAAQAQSPSSQEQSRTRTSTGGYKSSTSTGGWGTLKKNISASQMESTSTTGSWSRKRSAGGWGQQTKTPTSTPTSHNTNTRIHTNTNMNTETHTDTNTHSTSTINTASGQTSTPVSSDDEEDMRVQQQRDHELDQLHNQSRSATSSTQAPRNHATTNTHSNNTTTSTNTISSSSYNPPAMVTSAMDIDLDSTTTNQPEGPTLTAGYVQMDWFNYVYNVLLAPFFAKFFIRRYDTSSSPFSSTHPFLSTTASYTMTFSLQKPAGISFQSCAHALNELDYTPGSKKEMDRRVCGAYVKEIVGGELADLSRWIMVGDGLLKLTCLAENNPNNEEEAPNDKHKNKVKRMEQDAKTLNGSKANKKLESHYKHPLDSINKEYGARPMELTLQPAACGMVPELQHAAQLLLECHPPLGPAREQQEQDQVQEDVQKAEKVDVVTIDLISDDDEDEESNNNQEQKAAASHGTPLNSERGQRISKLCSVLSSVKKACEWYQEAHGLYVQALRILALDQEEHGQLWRYTNREQGSNDDKLLPKTEEAVASWFMTKFKNKAKIGQELLKDLRSSVKEEDRIAKNDWFVKVVEHLVQGLVRLAGTWKVEWDKVNNREKKMEGWAKVKEEGAAAAAVDCGEGKNGGGADNEIIIVDSDSDGNGDGGCHDNGGSQDESGSQHENDVNKDKQAAGKNGRRWIQEDDDDDDSDDNDPIIIVDPPPTTNTSVLEKPKPQAQSKQTPYVATPAPSKKVAPSTKQPASIDQSPSLDEDASTLTSTKTPARPCTKSLVRQASSSSTKKKKICNSALPSPAKTPQKTIQNSPLQTPLPPVPTKLYPLSWEPIAKELVLLQQESSKQPSKKATTSSLHDFIPPRNRTSNAGESFRQSSFHLLVESLYTSLSFLQLDANDSDQKNGMALVVTTAQQLEDLLYKQLVLHPQQSAKSDEQSNNSHRKAYAEKVRSLRFNFSDKSNPTLGARVLLGEISLQRLVEMSAEELAGAKKRREREKAKEKGFVVYTKEDLVPVRRRKKMKRKDVVLEDEEETMEGVERDVSPVLGRKRSRKRLDELEETGDEKQKETEKGQDEVAADLMEDESEEQNVFVQDSVDNEALAVDSKTAETGKLDSGGKEQTGSPPKNTTSEQTAKTSNGLLSVEKSKLQQKNEKPDESSTVPKSPTSSERSAGKSNLLLSPRVCDEEKHSSQANTPSPRTKLGSIPSLLKNISPPPLVDAEKKSLESPKLSSQSMAVSSPKPAAPPAVQPSESDAEDADKEGHSFSFPTWPSPVGDDGTLTAELPTHLQPPLSPHDEACTSPSSKRQRIGTPRESGTLARPTQIGGSFPSRRRSTSSASADANGQQHVQHAIVSEYNAKDFRIVDYGFGAKGFRLNCQFVGDRMCRDMDYLLPSSLFVTKWESTDDFVQYIMVRTHRSQSLARVVRLYDDKKSRTEAYDAFFKKQGHQIVPRITVEEGLDVFIVTPRYHANEVMVRSMLVDRAGLNCGNGPIGGTYAVIVLRRYSRDELKQRAGHSSGENRSVTGGGSVEAVSGVDERYQLLGHDAEKSSWASGSCTNFDSKAAGDDHRDHPQVSGGVSEEDQCGDGNAWKQGSWGGGGSRQTSTGWQNKQNNVADKSDGAGWKNNTTSTEEKRDGSRNSWTGGQGLKSSRDYYGPQPTDDSSSFYEADATNEKTSDAATAKMGWAGAGNTSGEDPTMKRGWGSISSSKASKSTTQSGWGTTTSTGGGWASKKSGSRGWGSKKSEARGWGSNEASGRGSRKNGASGWGGRSKRSQAEPPPPGKGARKDASGWKTKGKPGNGNAGSSQGGWGRGNAKQSWRRN